MRFPDLVEQVHALEQRLVNYERDISYCLAEIRAIRHSLAAAVHKGQSTKDFHGPKEK